MRAKSDYGTNSAAFRRRLLVEQLESRRLLTAVPSLLADVNQRPNGSDPAEFVTFQDKLYFAAATNLRGHELWTSDGTAAGSALLKDISPGAVSSSPGGFVAMGDWLYFTAQNPQFGRELWRTDGTPEGTELVKDIYAGSASSSPSELTAIDDLLYFSALTGSSGRELWKSDGTAAGTTLVKDLHPSGNASPEHLTNIAGTLFLSAWTPDFGRELWKTDGTDEGTLLVKDIQEGNASSTPNSLVNLNGELLFSATSVELGRELWKSDGTESGTTNLGDLAVGAESSSPGQITATIDTAFFTASTTSTGMELWQTDGTPAGTKLTKDIRDGSIGSNPAQLTAVNEIIYFRAHQNSTGSELWKSDGTEAGTQLIKDIFPGVSSASPDKLINVEGQLFFTASSVGIGRELWSSNGSETGTLLVKDVRPGLDSSSVNHLAAFGTQVVFSALNESSERELWSSDGTDAGTTQVADINPATLSSSAHNFHNHEGTVYFAANDGVNGNELWKSDGTPETTQQVKDISIGSSNPREFLSLGSYVFFAANSHVGLELMKTDGSTDGTTLVKDIYTGGLSSNPRELTLLGNRILFTAQSPSEGHELWSSDGTTDGTHLLIDIRSGTSSSSPDQLTVVNDTLYFTAISDDHGRELWKSDGTPAGTSLVKDIREGANPSNPTDLTAFGSHLFFTVDDGLSGRELWKTDGTSDGTQMVIDIREGTGSASPTELTVVDETLFFSAYASDTGRELWRSDGTAVGSYLVKDVYPVAASSSPQQLTAADGNLYFSAHTSAAARELWISDGSEEGTRLVKDIFPGNQTADPTNLVSIGEFLFFIADDGINGREIWRTTGSEAETVMIADIRAGAGSNPNAFTNVNGALLFSAADGMHGIEPWQYLTNSAPVNIQLSSHHVAENLPIESVVGQLTTLDASENDSFTYSLINGNGDTDNSLFIIDGNQLKTAVAFDYEMGDQYSIRLRTTDGENQTLEKQLWVWIDDVNDRPSLSQIDTLETAGINAAFKISYDALFAESDAFDQDADPISFRVESISNGTLSKAGEPVVPGETLIDPTDQLVWTPPQDAQGIIPAFEVVAWDGALSSTPAVQVSVNVEAWSLALTFTDSVVAEAGPLLATTATIRRIGDLTDPLTVTVDNNDNSEIEVADQVTIPAGASAVTIDVMLVNDAELDGEQDVLVSLSANDYPLHSSTITVLDDDTADWRTIGGDISGTLSASDYQVLQPLSVRDGEVLTIAPGSQLKFQPNIGLLVPDTSRLMAVGNIANPIMFTSAAASPAAGDWQGVTIANATADHSILEYVEIAYAINGIANLNNNLARFHLTNSIVRQTSQYGVLVSVGYGNFLAPSDVSISENQIYQNQQGGILLGARGISGNPPRSGSNQATVTANEIFENPIGINIFASYSIAGGLVGSASAGPTIVGNYLHHNDKGLRGSASKPSGAFGSAWLSGTYVNNLIVENFGIGMEFVRSSGLLAPEIINNTVALNDAEGIKHDVLHSSTLLHNNLVASNASGIVATSNWNVPEEQVGYNNVWGHNDGDWVGYPDLYGNLNTTNANGTPADAEQNLSINPQFIQPGSDYRLRITSQMINAGSSAEAPADDHDGNLREAAPDIGSLEMIPSAPIEIQLSDDTLDEEQPIGTVVGLLSSIDVDIDDMHSYELVAGLGSDDNELFAINGDQLTTAAIFDFESQATIDIRLRSTDLLGLSLEQTFVLQVLDVNEAPIAINVINAMGNIAENSDTGSAIKIADLAVVDDALGANELSLSGADAEFFQLIGDALYLRAAVDLDFEAQSSYTVQIEVDDPTVGDTPDATADLILGVLDLPEVAEVSISDGSIQRSRVDQVVVTFDGLVEIGETAFAITNRDNDQFITSQFQSFVIADQTVAIITFSGDGTRANGALVDGNFQMSIAASQVTRDEQPLDGDQDGVAGGDYQFGESAADNFFAFYGDTNGDRLVNFVDFLAFRSAFGTIEEDNEYEFWLDYQDDQAINFVDFLAFRSRFGEELGF
ncbi:ELWxxDGT repeat protein [Planctomycetaceae bacterium SH139]